MPLTRALICCLAFGVGFIGVSRLSFEFFPERLGAAEIPLKLARLRENPDRYNVILVGSSTVQTHLIPRVIDTDLRQLGVMGRVFNFGATGLSFPETAFVLDRLLEIPSGDRRAEKWIGIEIAPALLRIPDLFRTTERAVTCHDWSTTVLASRLLFQKFERWPRNPGDFWRTDRNFLLEEIGAHMTYFFRRATNEGVAADRLQKLARPGPPPGFAYLGPEGDGFVPLRKQISGPELEKYNGLLAKARERRLPDSVVNPVVSEVRLFDTYRKRLETHGYRVFYYVPPRVEDGFGQLERGLRDTGVPVISYLKVKDHERLFAPELRADETHLNATGAELLSHDFASRLGKLMRQSSSQMAASPASSRP